VAQGSLEELRAGAGRARESDSDEEAASSSARLRSLEQIFLDVVGTDRSGNPAATPSEQELSWLG
jgi:hypothetical protein